MKDTKKKAIYISKSFNMPNNNKLGHSQTQRLPGSATRETAKTRVKINTSSSLDRARDHSPNSSNSLRQMDTFENNIKQVTKVDLSIPSCESLADSETHNDSEIIRQIGEGSKELTSTHHV